MSLKKIIILIVSLIISIGGLYLGNFLPNKGFIVVPYIVFICIFGFLPIVFLIANSGFGDWCFDKLDGFLNWMDN